MYCSLPNGLYFFFKGSKSAPKQAIYLKTKTKNNQTSQKKWLIGLSVKINCVSPKKFVLPYDSCKLRNQPGLFFM